MSYYPEYTIQGRYPADKSICISECAEAWGILSNFYRTPITFEGVTYISVEQLYHSIRLHNTEERVKFIKLPPPFLALRGRQTPLSEKDWKGWIGDILLLM